MNWFIVAYFVVCICYGSIVNAIPAFYIIFVVVPVLLLLWQVLIVRARFQEPSEESASLLYERLEDGDWWRVFWILSVGHWSLSSHYVWGFWLFSGIVVVLLVILVSTALVELYRRRNVTLLVIGCIAFTFILLTLERDMYVVHYGVPIIGHFFEKPEYDAKYQVNIQPKDSNVKYKAIADIHVGGRSEEEEAGEDRYGNTRYAIVKYHDVWVKKVYLSKGRSISIEEQDEPLHLGDSVFVEDADGIKWYITLLNEPISDSKNK